MNDGLFEGLFIKKPTNLAEFGHTLDLLFSGNMDHPEIITLKSSRFEFSIDKSTNWTLDGEDGGSHNHAVIQNHKQALTMIMP